MVYVVTASAGKYFIDGIQTPSLQLYENQTYTFDTTALGTDHPFRLSTVSDGGGAQPNTSPDEYTTGTNYTTGSTSITVAVGAPSTLYYYCNNHPGMGGGITVSSSSGDSVSSSSTLDYRSYYSDSLSIGNDTQHVAVTLDVAAGHAVFYLDGVSVKTVNLYSTETIQTSLTGIKFGEDFTGDLEHGAIFDRCLDPSEIKRLAGARSATTIKNVEEWTQVAATLDKSSGTVAMFKNGCKIGDATVDMSSMTLTNASEDLTVGKNLDGSIDRVVTFDTELTEAEMAPLAYSKRFGLNRKENLNKTVLKCMFNDTISLCQMLKGKYFLFCYKKNHEDGTVGPFQQFIDVDFRKGDNELWPKSTNKNESYYELYELNEVSDVSNIMIRNQSSGTHIVKEVELYYADFLPSGKTISSFTYFDLYDFKNQATAKYSQTFHLAKGEVIENTISNRVAINRTESGMHGLFSAPPTFSSSYGGTHNQSALFGYTGDAPDISLVFSGNKSGLSSFDYTDSYISAWIWVEAGFTKCFKIFHKGDNLCFKVKLKNDALRLLADVGGVACDSGIDIDSDKWYNVGLHISKQDGTVSFFSKDKDAHHNEFYQRTSHTDFTAVNGSSPVYVGTDKSTGATFVVTASAGKYFIDGVETPTLELYENETYIFDTTALGTDHPFRLSTVSDGRDGIVKHGLAGSGINYTTSSTSFTVAAGSPSTLYYYCDNHPDMGGGITVSSSSGDLSGNRVWVDNLRVDVGFFDGESDFLQMADVDNDVTIPEIHKDQWVHVAATYNPEAGCVKLYHSGELVGKYTNYFVNMEDGQHDDITLGSLRGDQGYASLTDGIVLSEVNVYDRVLTDTQVYGLVGGV